MTSRDTLSRSLHDAGLAAWFGGTLANAVALNPAAGAAGSDRAAGAVANAGWDRWTAVNAAAIGGHLIGSVGQLTGNKGRLTAQQGVATTSGVKVALTAAALGATAYARVLGRRVSQHDDPPADSGTRPTDDTPPEVAAAQRQLRVLQWAIPAVTGLLVVQSSLMSEQQRATQQLRGLARRVDPR